jgi:hypothetical protein
MNKNIFFTLAIIMSLSQLLEAQVQYKIALDSADPNNYIVSMLPQVTWEYPLNLTSTAQVTIKIPTGMPFDAEISSVAQGVEWQANSFVAQPIGDPTHDYVSFGMVTMGTSAFSYTEGTEVALFKFRNTAMPCIGEIALVDENQEPVQGLDGEYYNVGNQISVLGGGGNVYNGNAQGSVDCSIVNAINPLNATFDISTYPNPTSDKLNVAINRLPNSSQLEKLTINIINELGQTMAVRSLPANSANQLVVFDVSKYANGVYMLQIVSDTHSAYIQKINVIK